MAKSERIDILSFGKNMKQLELSSTSGQNAKCPSTLESSLSVS